MKLPLALLALLTSSSADPSAHVPGLPERDALAAATPAAAVESKSAKDTASPKKPKPKPKPVPPAPPKPGSDPCPPCGMG